VLPHWYFQKLDCAWNGYNLLIFRQRINKSSLKWNPRIIQSTLSRKYCAETNIPFKPSFGYGPAQLFCHFLLFNRILSNLRLEKRCCFDCRKRSSSYCAYPLPCWQIHSSLLVAVSPWVGWFGYRSYGIFLVRIGGIASAACHAFFEGKQICWATLLKSKCYLKNYMDRSFLLFTKLCFTNSRKTGRKKLAFHR